MAKRGRRVVVSWRRYLNNKNPILRIWGKIAADPPTRNLKITLLTGF